MSKKQTKRHEENKIEEEKEQIDPFTVSNGHCITGDLLMQEEAIEEKGMLEERVNDSYNRVTMNIDEGLINIDKGLIDDSDDDDNNGQNYYYRDEELGEQLNVNTS